MLEYIVLYWSFFVLKMRNKYFCFNFIHNFCFNFERSDPLNSKTLIRVFEERVKGFRGNR